MMGASTGAKDPADRPKELANASDRQYGRLERKGQGYSATSREARVEQSDPDSETAIPGNLPSVYPASRDVPHAIETSVSSERTR